MYLKSLFAVLAFVFVLALPKDSSAELLVTYIFSPPPNSDFLVTGGVALPVFKGDRVSLGVGFNAGVIWDSVDPARKGRHAHFTWMPTIPVTVRVGESWGITGGYGWGFVKNAKPHLPNYKSWFLGLAFGI
ncbi:MAG: hypothetical protein KW804_00295 [Candidatus Doudnabacteria bacterium]|nr:hypothetical protein [Candidatus Doudnabacteria bacterium]